MDEEEKRNLARAITDRLPAPEEIRDDWGKLIIETVMPEGVWSRPGMTVSMISLPQSSRISSGAGSRSVMARARFSFSSSSMIPRSTGSHARDCTRTLRSGWKNADLAACGVTRSKMTCRKLGFVSIRAPVYGTRRSISGRRLNPSPTDYRSAIGEPE